MVDTIALILDNADFKITDPDKFNPSTRFILAKRAILAKQNPLKKELLSGIYKPKLTLFIQVDLKLKIELSLPKLFFGNNFNELQYKDFSELNKKLVSVLQTMGIQTTESSLSNALVSAIHYSKNIPLTDGSTPYHFINKIKSTNVKLSLDTNQTDYKNDGHSYKWHCNSYEVIFYDKIKELEKTKKSIKRSIEPFPFDLTQGRDTILLRKITQDDWKKLIGKLRSNGKKFELLRMEVRLNRKKIKHLFKKLNIKTDLTFKKLFKPAISKKVLLHYFDEIENKRNALLDIKIADYPLLVSLFFNNPKLKPSKIFQIFGLKKALESMTIRELRNLLKNHHQRSMQRLFADISKINLPKQESSLKPIRDCLEKFKPVKFSKFFS